MKTTLDTDIYLFQILKNSAEIIDEISGDVYPGDRPDNSELEDITVNTINLTQDYVPQKGTSNVNIHVPDLDITVSGKLQKKADKARLKLITDLVLNVLTAARIEGLGFVIANQAVLKENDLFQHYTNLRIDWSIH